VEVENGRRRSWFGSSFILLSGVLTFATPTQTPSAQSTSTTNQASKRSTANKVDATRHDYVGDQACKSCHAEKVEDFQQTAHYLTSRLPAKDSILGDFTPKQNVLKTSNPELYFLMEQKGDAFLQTAVEGEPPYTDSRSERFGLVVGSGGKGQTYLYWKGDRLFQLPVSYWRELGWVNSPGYRDGVANFQRPIIPRCLECHATYFKPLPDTSNAYDQSRFTVGITCEKCHGPARQHIEHAPSTSSPPPSTILNPARFDRERQIDLCAWCHAGHGMAVRPAFSYVPGQPLDNYLALPPSDPDAPIDVHGDQVDLLRRSRCFQSSSMTCLTCHDVHTVQHNPDTFSQRCLSCHKPGTVAFPRRGHQANSNCINCHMPKQDTNLIVFDAQGRKRKPQVRSHWIKIYAPSELAP
jgi:Cytochrome c554 and c-prime